MGGGGTNTTTQTADPWEGQQPYLRDVMAQAQGLYQQGGPQFFPNATYVPFSPQTQMGLDSMWNQAAGPQPVQDAKPQPKREPRPAKESKPEPRPVAEARPESKPEPKPAKEVTPEPKPSPKPEGRLLPWDEPAPKPTEAPKPTSVSVENPSQD